jgi:hypothetical protein
MEEKIILSKYADTTLGDRFNVKYFITALNKAILDFCMRVLDHMVDDDMTLIDGTLSRCCQLFATCMYYTYINDKKFCAELMQNMRKGSSDIFPREPLWYIASITMVLSIRRLLPLEL